MPRATPSLLRTLRAYAPWLVLMVSVAVCAPAVLAPWGLGATTAAITSEADPAESNLEKKEEEQVVVHVVPPLGRSSLVQHTRIADGQAPEGCVPQAPPTPPPDQNA